MLSHSLRIIVLLLVWSFAQSSFAQVSNINPAINIINGKIFYVHHVLEGQEIEKIAAAYYSEIPPIVEANPSIRTGLKVGMKLKIPISDASLEPLSQVKIPDSTEEVVEEEPRRIESQPIEPMRLTSPEVVVPKKNQSPMQEAIALLEEVEQEDTVKQSLESQEVQLNAEEDPLAIYDALEPEEEEVLQDTEIVILDSLPQEIASEEVLDEVEIEAPEKVQTLAESIRESLLTLQKMKDVLSGEPVENVLDVEIQTNQDGSPKTVIQFVEEDLAQFIAEDSVGESYQLKEYFNARMLPSGVITELKDERTETNENTHYFEMDELIGLTSLNYPNLPERDSETAFGVIADVQLFRYKAKVKKNKIKLYRGDFYAEHLKKDHRHYNLIMDQVAASQAYGKYVILIVDGEIATARFEQKEYNPFALLKDTIDKENIMRIESMEPF